MITKNKADITCPTPEEIPDLVDRAAVLESEIAVRSAELKTIKARLELAALNEHAEPLKNAEREGRKVSLPGTRHRATVIVSSDSLIAGFRDKSETHAKLIEILEHDAEASDVTAAELLGKFFAPPSKWESRFDDGHKFRQAAAEWLSTKTAPKFIAACRSTNKAGIPKNTIKMEFEAQTQTEGVN